MSWSGSAWASLFGLLFFLIFFLFFKINPAKSHREEKTKLTAEPPHHCCSLHPWSEMVGNQRRKGLLERSQLQPSSRSWIYVLPLKKRKPKVRLGRRRKIKAPADARDFQSAVSVQPRRHRSYVDYSLHSTALLWTHLRMAADSVQWTVRLEV